ncbi:hypothetical protein NQZ79_g5865 [Umbelopsis isabellina]|nr:hypothetical protein NQZ79_g5865 [Umbelopsis isabellina]
MALKALALVRSGKEEEATELCAQVKASQPTDEATLQAATMAYKEVGQHDQIVHLYEAAAKLQPNNEEFANHWFMAMVRGNDLKGQQQAALKLHKTFKNNKYLFWAIMSLALQGEANKSGANNLSYTLAERMMTKAMEEGRVQQTEELRLYLLILIGQDKKKEALALLDSEPGQKALLDPEIRQMYVDLMIETGDWTRAFDTSRSVLSENSDDWISWTVYFDSLFQRVSEKPECEQELLGEAHALIEKLKKSALEASILKRGPFLAELELDSRIMKKNNNIELDVAMDHIKAYFDRFGTKPCCFEDLQPYADTFISSAEDSTNFIHSIRDATRLDSEETSAKLKNIQKDINIYKLEHYLKSNESLSDEEAFRKVEKLWTAYTSALPFGETLEKTERQYGDDYVVLASQILLKKYREKQDMSYILHSIMMLETALAKSIYNFQFKMSLIRLYLIVGAYEPAHHIFSTLDVKHIQFDTLTHYLTDRSIALGQFDQLADTISMACSIYKSNEIETPEMIVKAYQYATFSKITPSNIHFSTSILLALKLFRAPLLPNTKLAQLSDNRDYGVMMDCSPKNATSIEALSRPAKRTNPSWIKLQSLILRTMHNACDSKSANLEIANELQAAAQNEAIQKDVSEQEIFMANMIASIVIALNHLQNSDESQHLKATELLERVIQDLNVFITSHEPLAADNISWNYFHQTMAEIECVVYGAILSEVIKRAIGMSKKKKSDTAETSEAAKVAQQFHAGIKNSFIELSKKTRQSKDVVKPQLQKLLQKKLIDHDCLSEFYKPKADALISHSQENQALLGDIMKRLVHSWNNSVQVFMEEVDKRVQKL